MIESRYDHQREIAEKQAAHYKQAAQYAHEDRMRNAYVDPHQDIKSVGRVTHELRQMEKNMQALMASIDVLNNKLAPLIAPRPEKDHRGAIQGASSSSELGDFLGRMNQALTEQAVRVTIITEGIDL